MILDGQRYVKEIIKFISIKRNDSDMANNEKRKKKKDKQQCTKKQQTKLKTEQHELNQIPGVIQS